MNTIFQIIKQENYGRYLFLHRIDGRIVGINFHYDNGEEPMESYYEPDCKMTNIYHLLSDVKDEEQRINASIEIFIFNKRQSEAPKVDGNTIVIPKAQINLVRNAISFYIQSLDTLRPVLTEDEEYTCFDLRQLDGMLQYEVSVKLTNDESKYFTSLHGVDLPEYVY